MSPTATSSFKRAYSRESSWPRCLWSKLFGSLKADSTSRRRRANFARWGRKSMVGVKTIRPRRQDLSGRSSVKTLLLFLLRLGGGGLGSVRFRHALLEFIDAAGGIDKLLL